MLIINNNQRINNFNNINHQKYAFTGYKQYIDEETVDEFVSNIIKNERIKNNGIQNYTENISHIELKKYCDKVTSAIRQFVIDNHIFFIKDDGKGNLSVQKFERL